MQEYYSQEYLLLVDCGFLYKCVFFIFNRFCVFYINDIRNWIYYVSFSDWSFISSNVWLMNYDSCYDCILAFFESGNRVLWHVERLLNEGHFYNHCLRTNGLEPDVPVTTPRRDGDQRHPRQRQPFNLFYFFPFHRIPRKLLQTFPNQLSKQQANLLFRKIFHQP